MYKSLHSERVRPEQGRKGPTKRVVKCSNSALLIALTILTTALAAYSVTVIFKPARPVRQERGVANDSVLFSDDLLSVSDAAQFVKRADVRPNGSRREPEKTSGHQRRPPKESEPAKIKLAASELISTRVEPNQAAAGGLDMDRFRVKLALLSRADLLKLLKIVQIRLDHTIRKRQALSVANKNDRPMLSASAQRNTTSVSATSRRPAEVVMHSEKMNKLMRYLEDIESNMPQIGQTQLERLTALDDDTSVVRVIRPEVMKEVLRPAAAAASKQLAESPAISSWRDPIESVAPGNGEQWPQEPIEDWPSGTTLAPTTQRPRKKKRKRVTTTSTTTTTTTTTQAPETTSTTLAPSQAFEEVWIEEEEDIVRPPRRKTKKYKKKTSAAPEVSSTTSTTTSTTSTTTTTTTTTPAPTTTLQPAIIEDWPEEQWPQQEQAISTKSPKLWPDQPQQAPPEEVEKWPEEEWLNELRDDIQSRLHLVYNS